MEIRYLFHSGFELVSSNGTVVLIDPMLDPRTTTAQHIADMKADYIVLTHAHWDHIGSAFEIAKGKSTTFICVSELAEYVVSKGFNAHFMHIGGSHKFPFGKVKLTMATHGSITPEHTYAGPAAGALIMMDGLTVYHTGDTGVFYDMKLIGELNPIDYMMLPIGDNFTMGIGDAVKAVELANPRIAIPMHYNTAEQIMVDPNEFCTKVTTLGKTCHIMNPGDILTCLPE